MNPIPLVKDKLAEDTQTQQQETHTGELDETRKDFFEAIPNAAKEYSEGIKGEVYLSETFEEVEKFSKEDLERAYREGARMALSSSLLQKDEHEAYTMFKAGERAGIRSMLYENTLGTVCVASYEHIMLWKKTPPNSHREFLDLKHYPVKHYQWDEQWAQNYVKECMRLKKIEPTKDNSWKK